MAKAVPHGTNTGYSYHKCRCDPCKAAAREKRRLWKEAHPDYRKQQWERHREKEAEQQRLWRLANPEYRRNHYEANREKTAGDLRRWRAANPERYKENGRRYREETGYNRIYRQNNPEVHRRWVEANPERWTELQRLGSARRRARMREAFVEDVPRLEVFERDNWVCLIPGCYFPGVRATLDVPWPNPLFATLDHVIPLSKGGLHEKTNCVCAHFRCNASKKDRLEGIA